MKPSRNPGVALILVVGTLGILAALGSSLAILSRLEVRTARHRTLATRASLLARSGLEDAVARLDRGQIPTYGGEDLDADGVLGAAEEADEVYRPGRLDVETCPVRHALRPSYFVGGTPALVTVDGRRRGLSGRLGGAHYALRIVRDDGFHVNGGDPAAGAAVGYNAVLRRMLGTLSEALDREDGTDDGLPVDETDGWNLVDLRPLTGWRSLDQIATVALGGDSGKLASLTPYLALDAWTDLHVVAPNTPASLKNRGFRSWGEIKLAHSVGAAGLRAPDFERINGRIVGRAPVRLAWARRLKPALIALLSGIKGLYFREDVSCWAGQDAVGSLREAVILNAWDPSDECHAISDRILACTSELSTWQEWDAFCDALPMTGTSDEAQGKRDLLKAHFNPNTDLNKLSPDASRWKTLDKSDLLAYSTELSLEAMNGFRISSEGRLLGSGGRLLARRCLETALAGPRVLRITTQREFAANDLGNLDLPGDEGVPRMPGNMSIPFLSQNRTLQKTWGHTIFSMGMVNVGIGLQCHPEPYRGAALQLTAADYDGSLRLATIETPSGSPGITMLARFDDAFEPDFPAGSTCVPDLLQVTAAQLGNSVLHASRPSTLYPDGIYSELDRAPAFPDRGRVHGFHGAISLWVKPNYRSPENWDLSASARNRRDRAYVIRTNSPTQASTENNQLFLLGDVRYQWGALAPMRGLFLQYEVGHTVADAMEEHQFDALDGIPPPHTWSLVTAAWDSLCGGESESGMVILNDGTGGRIGNVDRYHDPSTANGFWDAADLTLDEGTSPHLTVLGTRATRDTFISAYAGRGADATMDELALYDFGGAVGGSTVPPASLMAPQILAQNRFREGRYHKGWRDAPPGPMVGPHNLPDQAGSYYTAPIRLPARSWIRSVSWTWSRPVELPGDYAEVELVPAGFVSGGTRYLWEESDSRSTLAPGWSPDLQRWTVDREAQAPFRMRVLFRRTTPLDPDTPILDSPVMDDLTLLYSPPGMGRIKSWEIGS